MSDPVPLAPTWPVYARQAVEHATRNADAIRPAAPPPDAPREYGGVFVTLKKFGRLRGCMGLLDPAEPLPEAVCRAAIAAALHDPRFPPVGPGELPDIRIDVSILSQPYPLRSLENLELGVHGVIVQSGHHRGLFLPQVAIEHHLNREQFLSRCCSEKAGLAPDAWKNPGTSILLFTAEVHRDSE